MVMATQRHPPSSHMRARGEITRISASYEVTPDREALIFPSHFLKVTVIYNAD
jgi:hypothetical protein